MIFAIDEGLKLARHDDRARPHDGQLDVTRLICGPENRFAGQRPIHVLHLVDKLSQPSRLKAKLKLRREAVRRDTELRAIARVVRVAFYRV